jgi:eukaryotic-like serine/threonine-protein kinase
VLIDHVIGGKYRITELIGQGGMGTVFEAVHTGTGSRVAIKLIVSNDIKEEVFVRFQREARAAGTIDSQHIVRIFDMGTDERSGSPYMVMERLFGEDLSQVMRRVGPMAPDVSCSLVAQAALGVAKAHESGVIHRDIKPANLFMHDGDTGNIVVKILDFGIAKVRMDALQRAEEGGLTRTGSMLGSPHYMSPEQAQGLRSIDHRTDIWSLGVVLYKMLTGQTPHAHLTTLGQVILAICSAPPRPVQELAPWVPPEIAMIVHRALQADPGQRWQSAYEMYQALVPFAQLRPTVSRAELTPLSDTQRSHVAPAAPSYPRSDVPTNGTQHGMVQSPAAVGPRSNRGVVYAMAGLGVMAAIGLAGIGAAVVARKPAQARPTTGASTVTAENTSTAPVTPATTTAPPVATVAVAPADRTVKVAVAPTNATVDVDGQKRDVVDGNIELKGPLGSVQKVHVVSNGAEVTQAVAITEGGAIPPKVIVVAAGTVSPTGKPVGPKPGPGAGGVKPTPSGTGTTLNVQRNFE